MAPTGPWLCHHRRDFDLYCTVLVPKREFGKEYNASLFLRSGSRKQFALLSFFMVYIAIFWSICGVLWEQLYPCSPIHDVQVFRDSQGSFW